MKNTARIFLIIALFVTAFSSTALAQDDPFAAYNGTPPAAAPVVEEQITGEVVAPMPTISPVAPPPTMAAPTAIAAPEYVSAPAVASSEESPVEEEGGEAALIKAEDLVKEGRFSIVSNLGFAFDYTTNELSKSNAANAAFFSRLDLGVGYNLLDQLTLELTAGAALRRSPLESGSVTEHDWIFQLGALYQYPWALLGPKSTLIGGGGMGAYFGGFTIGETQEVSTSGFIGNLKGGIGYLFAENWNFRLLLDATVLIGAASDSAGKNYLATATHVGIDLGFTYTF